MFCGVFLLYVPILAPHPLLPLLSQLEGLNLAAFRVARGLRAFSIRSGHHSVGFSQLAKSSVWTMTGIELSCQPPAERALARAAWTIDRNDSRRQPCRRFQRSNHVKRFLQASFGFTLSHLVASVPSAD